MNEIIQKIKTYHKGLSELSKLNLSEEFKEDLALHKMAYPNFLDGCDDEELKSYLFENMVSTPLYKLFSYISANRSVAIDETQIGNEYRIDSRQVSEIIRLTSNKSRILLLKSVNVPSSVYADLSDGVLENNPEALKRAEEKHDLTEFFKKLSFIYGIASDLSKMEGESKTMLWMDTIVEYDLGKKFNFDIAFEDQEFDSLVSETKRLLKVNYYGHSKSLTDWEKKAVSGLIQSCKEYKSFFEGMAKEFSPEVRRAVDLLKFNQSEHNTDGNIIKGVEGLAQALGCGKNTAQKILNKNILQKEKIAYHAGKGWRISRSKLFDFLSQHPNALKE